MILPAAPEQATPKRRRKRRRIDPADRLAEIGSEMVRVRAREEKRLIAVARKAGLFDVRLTSSELREMINATIADLRPALSTLAKLEGRKARAANAKRRDDGRRKAFLGGFLVAQCRHKPGMHKKIAPDIRAFLEDHPQRHVAERNLALLADFLADPARTSVAAGRRDRETQRSLSPADHRVRAHRQILLGTWLLARRDTDPEIARLIADDLAGFLCGDGNVARNRELLADLLPDGPT